MSSLGCPDCSTLNVDEALEEIKQRARKAAIDNGEAQAVYKDGNEYKYISAYHAINNGFVVVTILSAYY